MLRWLVCFALVPALSVLGGCAQECERDLDGDGICKNDVCPFDTTNELTESGYCNRVYVGGGIDLEGVDLSGKDLRYVTFDKTNLLGADLSGADLSYATFEKVSGWGVNLSGADLTYAEFLSSNVMAANFQGAALEYANFEFSNLMEANLMGATMTGYQSTSMFGNTTCPDGTNSDANDDTCVGHYVLDCVANGASGTITMNHSHPMAVSAADVIEGVEKAYEIQGGANHSHTVTLTAEHFTILREAAFVTLVVENTHTARVQCLR
jgi:hypothetical protein